MTQSIPMAPGKRDPDQVPVTIWMHKDLKADVLAKLATLKNGETLSSLVRRYLERWVR